MTSKAALLALLTVWGVGAAVPHQAWADETTTSEHATEDEDAPLPPGDLTNRIWVKAGDAAALPGAIKIFLSDGTLVQDSVWETHRMSPWQMTGAKTLAWTENGAEVRADIVTLTADELVLSLKLRGGVVEERYAPSVDLGEA